MSADYWIRLPKLGSVLPVAQYAERDHVNLATVFGDLNVRPIAQAGQAGIYEQHYCGIRAILPEFAAQKRRPENLVVGSFQVTVTHPLLS
jgi:hypothetical protein